MLSRLAAALLLVGCGAGERGQDRGPKTEEAAEPAASSEAPASARAVEPEPRPAEQRRRARTRLDAHVHLLDGAVDELLAAMDRAGIQRAVVLASPHLDPAHATPRGVEPFSTWRAANDRLLAQTADHRDRLIPFITLEPAQAEVAELEAWLARGACGVKLYVGHAALHARPLADPSHAAVLAALERERVPVLLHVNTVRFEDELGELLRAYPQLDLVCPHLCGSRTDLDRLERILSDHPRLRVDTSHGGAAHAAEGFANLERERERIRGLIVAQPERFLFGSDLVTLVAAAGPEATRVEWDQQVAANLGLLEDERFAFWRAGELPGSLRPGEYAGLQLDDATLDAVLERNAARWVGACER